MTSMIHIRMPIIMHRFKAEFSDNKEINELLSADLVQISYDLAGLFGEMSIVCNEENINAIDAYFETPKDITVIAIDGKNGDDLLAVFLHGVTCTSMAMAFNYKESDALEIVVKFNFISYNIIT